VIPATQPYEARFRQSHKLSDGRVHEYFSTKPVLAWDDDGGPLVAGKQRLAPADSYKNFHDVVPAGPPAVTALPGGGWVAEYKDDANGNTFEFPVVAWAIDTSGDLTPTIVYSDGMSDSATSLDNFVRLYHPDFETGS
jgi:hypothetical protein